MRSKIALALLLCFAGSSQAQDEVLLSNRASTAKPIPDYLLFKHFLAWVKDLDRKAIARGASDQYEFAAPFAIGAKLETRHIDAVRKEAYSLDEDLSKHDAKAATVVAAFRATAKSALLRGEAMPSAPPQLHELQQERETLIKSHMSILRKALGPEASNRLTNYMSNDIAPHISLQPIAVRRLSKTPITSQANQDQ